ncbi:S1C family serine protease [Magnetospirillum sulfuroxidans]|uniref:Trypsin-like peptidase domain-containing protein n=1 Tax=Magnetospirillum sulfuroxidans TaxID=611300 RepID=A0ABS5I6Z2_9PROT|nr:trypsin-like peptidase domain-containing protein [Magnetospirillum sulfuroxidans]MBR9970191.1 trypsin-like peptidase domain-containing protein [Magnetospirillum sulfuroxidans]
MKRDTTGRLWAARQALAAVLVALMCVPALGWASASGDLAALVQQARAAGEGAPDIAQLTLVEATSPYLLRIEGDIDFPFSVGIDLPLNAQPRSLSTALTGPIEETGRYVVAFDVALAKVSRKVRDLKDKSSRKIVSINKIDNPAFLRAVKQFDSYSAKLEKVPGNTKLVKLAEDARLKMTTTPQFIEQPIYGDYTYKLADVEERKVLTVNYYVIDRVTRTYAKSTFDTVENERFTVAYDVDTSDPQQSRFSADIMREKQLVDWERAPVVIPLSQVLDHAVAQGGPTLPIGSTETLLAQLGQDRNRAIARAVSEKYDDRPLNDPRFDSVVAIYTKGGMGSGFFVRPNIVMTNWHVVDDSAIIEMRLYDKRETFGQVIAKDVRLDLALVKVQDRGRPVEFMHGKDLKPGDSVDAIGHPRRQTFTITRGVVSAIRKKLAATNPAQKGDGVVYVQTDADINPGNSGGPLFKGNSVVGINTFGITESPGLNFSVHYSEAQNFLNSSMRGE